MGNFMTPEEESKQRTLAEFEEIKAQSDHFGWQADMEDAGDYCVIYLLLSSSKDHSKKLLVRLTCDDYPKTAPLLEFANPAGFSDKSLRNDVRAEFYPSGKGIVREPNRSLLPIVCLAGHRVYHANGWHETWRNPPPANWRIYSFVERLRTSLNEDWS